MKLSIVLPTYKEKKGIHYAVACLHKTLEQFTASYEIIFVNDGPRDETWHEIEKASIEHINVRGICLSRNFGKEAAIYAGLSEARGECVVVMDSDMQHPPEKILDMYALWEQGYEIVEGVKEHRGKESAFYKGASKLFYETIRRITKFNMESSSDYKLLDRKVVDSYLQLQENQLFFRALTYWLGYRSTSVAYVVNERVEGETTWSLRGLVRYAITNVTSFSMLPMQIVTALGILFSLLAIVVGVNAFVQFFNGEALEGFTTVILLLLIIGSIMMVSLGIIGYYIARIYDEVRKRPRYIVAEKTTDEEN
ncbi:MAG: glycosyltransferase family 2 protein [Caryophanon sp.]|nr:glycosyltransferase family 2 protein [Caryophanon sp.]